MSVPQPKPFTYTNLQAIFQYLEPNLKITLAQKIPSLQNVEKSTLFRMHLLSIEPYETQLESTPYTLEVIRFDPVERRIKPFLESNSGRSKEFKVRWDVDGQGRPISAAPATPGDIEFDMEEGTKIEEHQHLGKRKRQAPCEYFLKFTSGKEVVEYMKYDNNFHTAIKYMNEKLLGNRGPVTVGSLSVTGGKFLRLPENLKFKIERLEVYSMRNQMALIFELIERSSFTLEQIATDGIGLEDHTFLGLALRVKVMDCIEGNPEDIINLGNPPLPFDNFASEHLLSEEQFRVVLRDWKAGNRRVGTHFQFESMRMENEIKWFEFFKNQVELGAVLGTIPNIKPNATYPHCVIFPINDAKEIIVYYSVNFWFEDEDYEIEEDEDDGVEIFNLEMKVMAKGYATPVQR